VTAPVVVCTSSGADEEPPEEIGAALTLGRMVSSAVGAELVWLVVGAQPGDDTETGARYGVHRVDVISDPTLSTGRSDAFVEALAQYFGDRPAGLVVFAQTFDTRLVAPLVAARLDAGVVMNGVGIVPTDGTLEVTAAAFGGDTRVVYRTATNRPCVVGLLANSVDPEPAPTPTSPAIDQVDVDLSSVTERVRVVEAARAEGPRLEDAEIIVAGGRGLGSSDNFGLVEQLAEVLGGMAGASRPIVDDGWVDSSRQVGLTGKITRPALYIAAGISGATQHIVGCSAAKVIVAINTDPDAPIFRHARYGIVGDCTEVLPELIRAVEQGGASP
jgi:electron transfer flavoprotein alpha subunit